MISSRATLLSLFVACWLSFGWWQRAEYFHQTRLIKSTLENQANVLSDSLSSNVLSHRWFSPFVKQRLPNTLSSLAKSNNTLAVAVLDVPNTTGRDAMIGLFDGSMDDEDIFSAGDQKRIIQPVQVGVHWEADCLQLVRQFSMKSSPPFQSDVSQSEPNIFRSIVVLNRSLTDSQIARELRSRWLAFSLGSLLFVSIGIVWQFTIRVASAEGKAGVLQVEAQHHKELGQAAAGLAHETRNPLGLIRGWTQRLVDSRLPDPEQQKQAEAVLEECDRVTARINQFLAFARPDDPVIEPVAIEELVTELKLLLENELRQNQINMRTCEIDSNITVLADREQLRQVLFNLLQNAISFSPNEGIITVSAHMEPDSRCGIEIHDEGPGPAPEISDKLFEPYITNRASGTGLGLSIVRKIAAAHHWQVGYSKTTDSDTIFWIRNIPLHTSKKQR